LRFATATGDHRNIFASMTIPVAARSPSAGPLAAPEFFQSSELPPRLGPASAGLFFCAHGPASCGVRWPTCGRKSIGLNRRTLHRHLAREEQTFSSIIDAVRSELATRYIGDRDLASISTWVFGPKRFFAMVSQPVRLQRLRVACHPKFVTEIQRPCSGRYRGEIVFTAPLIPAHRGEAVVARPIFTTTGYR